MCVLLCPPRAEKINFSISRLMHPHSDSDEDNNNSSTTIATSTTTMISTYRPYALANGTTMISTAPKTAAVLDAAGLIDVDDDDKSSSSDNSHVNIDSLGGGPLTPLSCVKYRGLQSPRSRSSSPRSRYASRSCSESPELEVDSPPMSPALRLNNNNNNGFGGRENNNNSPSHKSQVRGV